MATSSHSGRLLVPATKTETLNARNWALYTIGPLHHHAIGPADSAEVADATKYVTIARHRASHRGST